MAEIGTAATSLHKLIKNRSVEVRYLEQLANGCWGWLRGVGCRERGWRGGGVYEGAELTIEKTVLLTYGWLERLASKLI